MRNVSKHLYIMGGLKPHTYHHLVASLEPSSAARCEKIYAGTSSCLCTRSSSAPSPDTSGIAPPVDTGRCKGEKRGQRGIADDTFPRVFDTWTSQRSGITTWLESADLAGTRRRQLTLSSAALSRSSSWSLRV